MTVRSLCDGSLAAGLLLLVLAGCSGDDDDDASASDPGGRDGGPSAPRDAAPPAPDAADTGTADAASEPSEFECRLELASKLVRVVDPEVQFKLPTFVWAGDGVVGAWPRFDSSGYRLIELDPKGEVKVPVRTLWPDEPAAGDPSIAVRDGVVALVDRRVVGVNSRGTCRIALVERDEGPVIAAPKRISDIPDDELATDEASDCQVVAVAEGFLVVWYQHVAVSPHSWALFAQVVAPDGSLLGKRLSLATSEAMRPESPFVRSDGERALVVSAERLTNQTKLTYVGDGEPETVEVALDSPPVLLDYGHGTFLLRSTDHLHFYDGAGQAVRAPINVGLRRRYAPLGEGYASLSQEEYVLAEAYDRDLVPRSAPVTLNGNRGTTADSFVYAPDGSSTAALLLDASEVLYLPLTCVRR